jgi:putative transposase
MLKAYKYRLYPTEDQKILLEKHFGSVRLIYNLALECKKNAYISARKNISCFDLIKQITDLKQEFGWLYEINNKSLQEAVRNLDSAYKNFFRNKRGFPKFKNKSSHQSFHCTQHIKIDFKKALLIITKFREGIPIVIDRKFKGEIRNVSISRTPTGKYFASVLVKNDQTIPLKKEIKSKTTIGIDLGIKTFAKLSDGESIDNPKYLRKSLKKLKRKQRELSRKKKGSNRRKKARERVARIYEKITNQRKDFLHKVSNEITNQYDTIALENLKISNMIKNHKLALSISDVGWGMFISFIKYKSEWKGKNILQIGTFQPSSKTCRVCGYIKEDLTLDDRDWVCPQCGTEHDRDLNAAINIKQMALCKYLGTEYACKDTEAVEYNTDEVSKVQDDFILKPSNR